MTTANYAPVVEVLRGPIVECVHFGSIAVSDASGRLLYAHGDPQLVTYLRSTAKPFQVLPFVELGGVEHFGLSDEELALLCASHSGTDKHVEVVRAIQAKVGASEADLMCGVHWPTHEGTAREMRRRGEEPTPNRHNCSGKHTGMLAQAALRQLPKQNYIAFDHPVQTLILQTFSEIVHVPVSAIHLGVDGCSAPVFGIPLHNAAWGLAQLADPSGLTPKRADAMRHIFHAMSSYPFMVAGPDRFDTKVMEAAGGKLVAKAGAEGYQGMSILADALYPGSPALGVAFKISDGDAGGRARPTVATEILRQLGVLDGGQLAELAAFDTRPQYNWRKIEVGSIRPAFLLEKLA